MFCSKCGCENNDGAAFCNSCGSQLSAPTNEKSTIKVDVELLPTKTRKGANICLTGSIIGAIVCFFIFVIFKPIVSSPVILKAYLIILIWVAVCSLFMLRKKTTISSHLFTYKKKRLTATLKLATCLEKKKTFLLKQFTLATLPLLITLL